MTLTIGSLFAGIGGLELGLEMTGGFRTVWQAEQNEYARRVLAQHWPDALRLEDVRDVTALSVPRADVLTGGFPCQPHSLAGKRLSSADERDLWGEFARIIGELEPRWVVAENVPGLLSSHDPAHGRGAGGFFGRVLRDLAQLGFNAEWHSVPAAAVGAPHLRYRVFLVAHAQHWGCKAERECQELGAAPSRKGDTGDQPSDASCNCGAALADPHGQRELQPARGIGNQREWVGDRATVSNPLAHPTGLRRGKADPAEHAQHSTAHDGRTGNPRGVRAGTPDVAYAGRAGCEEQHSPAQPGWAGEHPRCGDTPDWAGPHPHPLTEWEDGREVERDLRGMAHGIPARVERLERLGNAVVPKVAQSVGAAILEAETHYRLWGVMPAQIMLARHFRRAA